MSDPLRVALALEGDTDLVVIKAVVASLLPGREVEFQMLQPEISLAFGTIGGETGLGWSGVYRWCRQAAKEGGGGVSGSSLFRFHDVLIVHVDGDVAGKTYQSGKIEDPVQDLPCAQPCPPASATTNALRQIILRWMSETVTPARCVLCTPCMNTEAWVVIALYPSNAVFVKKGPAGWECHDDPEGQLRQQPLKVRIKKNKSHYESRKEAITVAWQAVRRASSEAERFSTELLAVLMQTPIIAKPSPPP
jgi:hypothetical protein